MLATLACGCSLLDDGTDPLADYPPPRQELNSAGDARVRPASHQESAAAAKPLAISDFSPAALSGTARQLIGAGPDADRAQQALEQAHATYAAATALFQQNRIDEARPQFLAAAGMYEAAAKKWPESSLEQDALFMQGECYFFADRYPRAEKCYEELLKKYPHSRHLDRVQPRRFAIAEYWLDVHRREPQSFYEWNLTDGTRPGRDTFGHALRIFDRIRLDDPTGKLADDATLALANAHFANGKFILADEHFSDLRKTFPSSNHQFHAHLLGLKSKLLNYQGADYSGNALQEAEDLLTQIRKQFPLEAQQEAEYLARAHAEIRYRQAERLWQRAQRRDRRSEYGAAKFYYGLVLKDYDDTPFAPRAEQRLREIGGRPDTPPQRLSWLVSLFPREEEAKPLIATDTIRR